MPTELVLRPARPDDLAAVADVHLAARAAAGPQIPPGVHSDDEVRAWVAGWDLTASDVWLAQSGGCVVGYARATPTWLDDLYVVPRVQGQGIGSALLEAMKAQRPDGFGLWVFESNTAARRFYARHGLVELERTDGSANEERAPDVKMVWPGREPLGYFRDLIDQVDDDLGDLLARRTALTRAVQVHKRAVVGVADPGRDDAREREIVARVAARVPELGVGRVARIVHEIITESIEASRADGG